VVLSVYSVPRITSCRVPCSSAARVRALFLARNKSERQKRVIILVGVAWSLHMYHSLVYYYHIIIVCAQIAPSCGSSRVHSTQTPVRRVKISPFRTRRSIPDAATSTYCRLSRRVQSLCLFLARARTAFVRKNGYPSYVRGLLLRGRLVSGFRAR
jgi:hypothetical protein